MLLSQRSKPRLLQKKEADHDLAKGSTLMCFINNISQVPECIKEALNPNAMTMYDLIDYDNPPITSDLLTCLPTDQTIHHKDEDMLLATDYSPEYNITRPPEDTA